MKYCPNPSLIIAYLLISLPPSGVAQVNYITDLNTSTRTANVVDDFATVNGNNIYVTYKRGHGSSAADNEIKVSVSNDDGLSWQEVDISVISTRTYQPVITATGSQVLVAYVFENSAGELNVCLARSENYGQSFELSVIDDPNAALVFRYSQRKLSTVNQQLATAWSYYNLIVTYSTDFGETFTTLVIDGNTPEFAQFPGDLLGQVRLNITENYQYLTMAKANDDSLFVFRSSDWFLSFSLLYKTSIDFSYGSMWATDVTGQRFTLAWSEESVGVKSLKYLHIDDQEIGSITTIDTRTDDYLFCCSLETDFSGDNPWIIIDGTDYYFKNDENSWSQLNDIKRIRRNASEKLSNSYLLPIDQQTVFAITDDKDDNFRKLRFASINLTQLPFALEESIYEVPGIQVVGLYWVSYVYFDRIRLQIGLEPSFSDPVLELVQSDSLRSWTGTDGSFFIDSRLHPEPFSQMGTSTIYYRYKGGNADLATAWSEPYSFELTILNTQQKSEIPRTYSLKPNYPNPFNSQTSISFKLPIASHVRIVIHDMIGREVMNLFEGELQPGNHSRSWDGTDTTGEELPSGIYFASLRTESINQTIRMVLLK